MEAELVLVPTSKLNSANTVLNISVGYTRVYARLPLTYSKCYAYYTRLIYCKHII